MDNNTIKMLQTMRNHPHKSQASSCSTKPVLEAETEDPLFLMTSYSR